MKTKAERQAERSGNRGGTPPHRSKQWRAFLYREGEKIGDAEGTLQEIKGTATAEGATAIIAGWNYGTGQALGVNYYIANPKTFKYNPVSHRIFSRITGIG